MCYSYIVNNPRGPSSYKYSCERSRDSHEFRASARMYSLPCSWAVPYFTYLYPVVINNSIPVLECWHKYPALKLSSISCSSALILVHIIKNNFNSAYCPCSIVTGTSDWHLLYLQFCNLLYQAMSVMATGKACIMLPHRRNFAVVLIMFNSVVYFLYNWGEP